GLEEAQRAQNAVVGLDEVIAGKPRNLAELRDKRLVDLADDLFRAGRVDALVTTNGGIHVMLLTVVFQGRSARMSELRRVRPEVTVGEERAKPRGLRQPEPTRCLQPSGNPVAPSDPRRSTSLVAPSCSGSV